MFYIGAKHDEHVYTGLSYLKEENVHIVEHAIHMACAAFKRLSNLL